MGWRSLVGAGIVAVLVGVIVWLRPAPEPPGREQDVVRALLTGFVLPMGDTQITGRPSDCRTNGQTKVAMPASLFAAFLAANESAEVPLDLGGLGTHVNVAQPSVTPRRLFAQTRTPVIGISRAALDGDQAVVCVEVFASEERAFFVFLRRSGGKWRVAREEVSWEAPEEEDLTADPEDGYG